jgi:hypothetical protein
MASDRLWSNEHRQHAEPEDHGGRGRHAGQEAQGGHGARFRDRLWWSLALTVPVVGYSEMVQEWLGFAPPPFPGSGWVAPVLGTVVFAYGGWPFLEGGLAQLRARQPGMMLRAQALADRAAGLLFWLAVGAGLVTMAVWLALGEPGQAVERTVTVLVIACPHALGLAIPLVIAISTGLGARNGILVKDRLALERMRTVDAVLLDKTGTLTTGKPTVSAVAAVDGDQDRLLRLAGAVEADSEHPWPGRSRPPPAPRPAATCRRLVRSGRWPAAASRPGSTARRWRWAARPCCASWPWPSPRRWPARSAPGGGAGPPSCMWSARARPWVRSPWRTRCGPSPARPSASCTGWAGGW